MLLSGKSRSLIFQFYRGYAVPAILFTFCSVGILYLSGIRLLPAVCWFKLLSDSIILYYIRSYRRSDYIYYHNLGLSKLQLWAYSLSLDTMVFLFGLIIALQLHPEIQRYK